MSTRADRPDDYDDALPEDDPEFVPLPTVDDAYSDEPSDPAMAPVIEAGGGVAEGFEQSEALLIDHATSEWDGTNRILRDAPAAEDEPDPAVYGDADEEHSSERESDWGDWQDAHAAAPALPPAGRARQSRTSPPAGCQPGRDAARWR